MGLEKAKSLLQVKGEDTFLDFIAKQVLHLRKVYDMPLKFMLMNSFSTSDDTKAFLAKYPELASDPNVADWYPENHREGQDEWCSHPDESLEVEGPFGHTKLAERQKDHVCIMVVEMPQILPCLDKIMQWVRVWGDLGLWHHLKMEHAIPLPLD
jgi:hypothetical protein